MRAILRSRAGKPSIFVDIGTVATMTPQELADLGHLRRARDLMDRDYALPLDVPAMSRAALMSPAQQGRATAAENARHGLIGIEQDRRSTGSGARSIVLA